MSACSKTTSHLPFSTSGKNAIFDIIPAMNISILALDGLPRAQIAGDYPALQAELDAGTKAPCPTETFPQFAPGPG